MTEAEPFNALNETEQEVIDLTSVEHQTSSKLPLVYSQP